MPDRAKLFHRLVDYLHLGVPLNGRLPAFLDQAAEELFILPLDTQPMGCEVFDGAGHFYVVAGDFHDGILYSIRNEATSQARLDVQFA